MPRVTPKPNPRPKPVEGDAVLGAALRVMLADQEKRRREQEPPYDALHKYGPGSPYSWFLDTLMVAESDKRASDAAMSPVLRGKDQGAFEPNAPGLRDFDLDEARRRLESARVFGKQEVRDLTTADPGGAAFLPPGVPGFLAADFAAAARAQATFIAALPTRPLPEFGMEVKVPWLENGTTAAAQASENAAVSETDADAALASSRVGYVAGQNDVSRQLFERSMPGIDEVLAADLGRALGVAADSEALYGVGTGTHTRGLTQTSGIITVTYTDATPTVAEFLAKVWSAFMSLSGASGYGVANPADYLTVMHPRRFAWLQGNSSTVAVSSLLPGTVVLSAAVTTIGGAGTNEDEVYILARSESFVAIDAPTLAIYPEVGSATGTVRLQARQALAAMFGRAPSSVAKVVGTGLTVPSL